VDELADEVSLALTEMADKKNKESNDLDNDDDQFPLTDVLEHVNRKRARSDLVARGELEKVLIALEEQNKLMYIRDGDDPVVMLI
jgi:hypothetical protein